MERLTTEGVEAAKRNEISHPIIDALTKHEGLIRQAGTALAGIEDSSDQQDFIRRTHGFLADDIAELPDYSLNPLDLVAIWSKATQVFGNLYQRYSLARVICLDYARRASQKSGKNLLRYFLENEDYPDTVYENDEIKKTFLLKLTEINGNVDEVLGWWKENRALDGAGNKKSLMPELLENFKQALFPLRTFLLTGKAEPVS